MSVSAALAIICGNLLVLGLEDLFGSEAVPGWGVQVPFLLAAPLGWSGSTCALKLNETPVYREMAKTEAQHSTPLVSAFKTQKANMVLAFFCSSIMGVGLLLRHLLRERAVAGRSVDPAHHPTVSAVALLIYAILCPIAGWISNNIGTPAVHRLAASDTWSGQCRSFKLVTPGTPVPPFRWPGHFAIPQAAERDGLITLVELFPPHNRSTGAAIGCWSGVGPIAGSAPRSRPPWSSTHREPDGGRLLPDGDRPGRHPRPRRPTARDVPPHPVAVRDHPRPVSVAVEGDEPATDQAAMA